MSDTTYSMVSRTTASGGGFTDEEISLIDDWTMDSEDIRSSFGKGEPSKDATAFDNFIDSGSDSRALYRGIQASESIISKYEVGAELQEGVPSSWSIDHGVAYDFANEIAYKSSNSRSVVFVMNGTSHGRYIADASNYPSEKEVAISSRSRRVITGMNERDGTLYVSVVEV